MSYHAREVAVRACIIEDMPAKKYSADLPHSRLLHFLDHIASYILLLPSCFHSWRKPIYSDPTQPFFFSSSSLCVKTLNILLKHTQQQAADMETASCSRQKSVVKKKNRDKISNLPDTILHHIFSSLDMNEAVRASILSKRWKHLWKTLPHLNFFNDVHLFEKDTHKMDFVDRVFLLRETSSNIQSLHFRIYSPILPVPPSLNIIKGHLTTWIFAAVKSSVQHLSVEILLGHWHPSRQRSRKSGMFSKGKNLPLFKFPDCLFTSKTLMSMELKTIHDQSYQRHFKTCVSANSIISLPLLKTLHLASLRLAQDSSSNENFITKIVSSCPVLESLIIQDCQFHCCTTSINISSVKLRHLVIEKCSITCNSAVSAEAAGVDLPAVHFKLNAPFLRSFSLMDCMSKDYTVEKFQFPLKANIDLDVKVEDTTSTTQLELPAERKRLYAQRMIKLLKALIDVEVLSLSPWFIEVISGATDSSENHLLFVCLECLELKTWFSSDCISSITSLLQVCPSIKTLSIEVTQKYATESMRYCDKTSLDSLNTGDYWELGLSMECRLYLLKVVKFQGYFGCHELKFLQFLLEKASVLQKLTIGFSSNHGYRPDEKKRAKFAEMLHASPRVSSRLTIIFL